MIKYYTFVHEKNGEVYTIEAKDLGEALILADRESAHFKFIRVTIINEEN